jgi:hypothetical protein
MQLGKTLLGAILGGAVGVGLLLATYFAFALDHTALAILVAVCAGVGVRMFVETKAHASYLRGALTCLVAILAFAGGKFLIADLAERGTFAKTLKVPPPQVEAEAPADGVSSGAASIETPKPVETESRRRGAPIGEGMMNAQRAFSTWDFVLLSIAALVAYELGRGTGPSAEPQPVIKPPDAA